MELQVSEESWIEDVIQMSLDTSTGWFNLSCSSNLSIVATQQSLVWVLARVILIGVDKSFLKRGKQLPQSSCSEDRVLLCPILLPSTVRRHWSDRNIYEQIMEFTDHIAPLTNQPVCLEWPLPRHRPSCDKLWRTIRLWLWTFRFFPHSFIFMGVIISV